MPARAQQCIARRSTIPYHIPRNRAGHVSSRPPQQRHPTIQNAHHRIVAPTNNRAIVGEKKIGDVLEAEDRLRLVRTKRLLAAISAGGHDSPRDFFEQKRVQRGRRQHHSDRWNPWGHLARQQPASIHRLANRPIKQHDGSGGRLEHRPLDFADTAETFRLGNIPRHYCKRFFRAAFPFSQPFYGGSVVGLHHQMKSAQTFDCYDLSAPQSCRCRCQSVFPYSQQLPVAIQPAQLWSAGGAGHRLRMKATIRRIGVLH